LFSLFIETTGRSVAKVRVKSCTPPVILIEYSID
jgi:hypothetical protein